MSKPLQVGSEIYNYPTQGENPGWGEEATGWAEAVTDALTAVQGPNDILLTSATLTNNQSSLADIPGFSFDTSQVQGIEATYFVVRTFDSGATVVTESGTLKGNYNGSDFIITVDAAGDSGVSLNITNAGQVQYTSTDLTDHVSSIIRFRAKTIDQP